MNNESKCIFFDRDGIINKRIVGGYVATPEEFEFIPDFFELYKIIRSKGYLAIVITNQQGIGKGLMGENDLQTVHEYMHKEMMQKGLQPFDDIYFCTDLAGSRSKRRKPEPGMLLEAIEKWSIDTSQSWFIGDSASDVIAGQKAGVKTILINDEILNPNPKPDFHAQSHKEAIEFFN